MNYVRVTYEKLTKKKGKTNTVKNIEHNKEGKKNSYNLLPHIIKCYQLYIKLNNSLFHLSEKGIFIRYTINYHNYAYSFDYQKKKKGKKKPILLVCFSSILEIVTIS